MKHNITKAHNIMNTSTPPPIQFSVLLNREVTLNKRSIMPP